MEQLCRETGLSRAGYYRHLAEHHPKEEEQEVRSVIQEIAVEHKRNYGFRRIQGELRDRGMKVNHKRILRIMREDNLLAIRIRRYVITTNSRHELDVYLNLAARMKLTGKNQLWVADITYIKLQHEFVYLAVVMDAWSRRIVGWCLDRSLATRLTVTALERAIAAREPQPGLVHHSDRGIQYASHDYIEVLEKHKMTPSMSRPANPYDNATCESFMKTLKKEEIYAHEYRDLEDLETHLEDFLERYYNKQRLHSSLGYRSPQEFEEQSGGESNEGMENAPKMSFFRHPKSTAPISDSNAKPKGETG